MGDLGLEIEDFETLTKEIVAVAETHAQGRIVSVLEGGYNVPILAGCVAAHLCAGSRLLRTGGLVGRPTSMQERPRDLDDPDGI